MQWRIYGGGGGYNSDPWLIISHLRVCNPLRFLQYLWSKFPVRKFSGSAPCTRMYYFADAMEHVGNKRTCYISWDEYFMGVALISAERSKDPVTQVFTTFHVEFTRLFCNEKYILILHFTTFLVKVCQEIVLTSSSIPLNIVSGWSMHCQPGEENRGCGIQWNAQWL